MSTKFGHNLHEVDEMIKYVPNARMAFFKHDNKKVDNARQKLAENDRMNQERLESMKGQPIMKFDQKVTRVIKCEKET